MKNRTPDNFNTAGLAESLLGRREFIFGAGGLMLTLGGLSLAGCGGVGGFGFTGGGAMVQVAGTLGLPAGFSIPVAQLSVVAGLGQTAVKAPSSFTAKIAGQSPSLATLLDSAGNGIMLGFLDPAKSSNTIDAHSTAVALIYFMLGAYSTPSTSTANILNLIASDSSIAALAQVIATRIAADPHAVQNGDAQIAAALTTSYNAINPSGPGAIRPAGTGKSPLGNPTAQLLVQPDGEISGLEVLQATSPLDIIATNHFRRRCKVFVYEVGNQASGGTLTMFPKVASFAGPIDLPSTQALGLINALVDMFKGQAPFNPISTGPITLPVGAGDTKTLYEVVILGASAHNADPVFYSDPRYVDQVPLFKSTRTSLNIQSLLIDVVFGIFLEMLGMRQIVASADAVETAATAVASIQDAAWQNVLLEAQSGKFGQAAIDLLEVVATSDFVSQKLRAALAPLLSAGEAAALQAAKDGAIAIAFAAAKKLILTVISATGVLLGFGDIGAVFYSLDNGDAGDVWQATAFIPAFALNPPSSTVSPGSRVTFTITPPIGVTGNIEYDWTQNSTFGTFSASDGTVGNSIKTTSASTTVDLVTTTSDTGTVTVKVIAYQVAAGGAKTEIGQVTAKVTLGSGGGFVGTNTPVIVSTPYIGDMGFKIVTISGITEFTPVAGATEYRVYVYGAWNGQVLTAAQITPLTTPVYDPTIYYGQPGVTQPIPYAGRFYNMGGGKVGYISAQQNTGDYPPYSNFDTNVATALAAVNATLTSINVQIFAV